MDTKQIFAALEISDQEVRLIVGEFFNTRFNIIHVERVFCHGLSLGSVSSEDDIVAAVKKAVKGAQKSLGAAIKAVILAIPSYRLKRYSLKVTQPVSGIDGTVGVTDVRNALQKAYSAKLPSNLVLIQAVPVKYEVNGIPTKRIPSGEKTDVIKVDIDLLCADRKLTFDLVTAVEKSGLQVMAIYTDMFAVGKESAVFDQDENRQTIMLKMERTATTMGFVKGSRLLAAAVLPAGTGTFVSKAADTYGISGETGVELLKYSIDLSAKEFSDRPIYIWPQNGETKTISEKQLFDCVKPVADEWINAIAKSCDAILQAGETAVIITGEGGEMEGLDVLLAQKLGVPVRNYVPETLGGRNAGLTACLGLFYAYQDELPISSATIDSLDMDAFSKAVAYRDKKKDEDGKEDTLTNKLKGLFKEKSN